MTKKKNTPSGKKGRGVRDRQTGRHYHKETEWKKFATKGPFRRARKGKLGGGKTMTSGKRAKGLRPNRQPRQQRVSKKSEKTGAAGSQTTNICDKKKGRAVSHGVHTKISPKKLAKKGSASKNYKQETGPSRKNIQSNVLPKHTSTPIKLGNQVHV